ncbi:major facilitator superfamily domain-containing protein [Diaporthe eres]|uniref:Major facilitator superfamily (MFS) profile domain-containing protein n=1 Tax=Diaporthe vaccinii TaxID=105482 RepID=A0ABR4F4E0_9PEZI|nr:major facilitator superfamily domain-containing protein [Diaporthe eres]
MSTVPADQTSHIFDRAGGGHKTTKIYETYYQQEYLKGYSPSTIAWIGSIQSFAQFSATLIGGPITDRWGPMSVIWPFSLLLVVAMMLTSLCTEFYQSLLCQGILLGFSCGLIFAPALTVVGHYFVKKRAMAMTYASTGSPIGGIIYPVVLTNLINNPSVGFAWAQRTCGFISLLLLLIAAVMIRPRPGMTRKSSLVILDAFKKPAYSLQVAGLFLVVLGFWTPYFYLATYAEAHGMSSILASYLFAIINAGSFAGRVLGGTFAQRASQFNVTALACYSSAVLLFCWLAITSSAGLIVLSVLFGGTSGIIIALMMSTVAHCAPHPSQIGAYVGQSTFVVGFAGLAGTPITGALINNSNGYTSGIAFSAAVMMAGAVVFTFARYAYAPGKLIA